MSPRTDWAMPLLSIARQPGNLAQSVKALAKFSRRQPLGMAGAAVLVLMALMAVSAPLIAPHGPLETNFSLQLRPPSARYLMGTDVFGRDVLSRLIYGSRTALLIGFVCAFVGATVGVIVGIISAYFGAMIDLLVQRVVDLFLSFPSLVLALAVISILGTGVPNVIMAISLPMIPQCARVARVTALSVREVPFIDAARAGGAGDWRIIFRHILPNVMPTYLILLTALMGQAILFEASLSFLGLGVTEPMPAWGLMLRGGAIDFAQSAPWLAVFPGFAISLAVFAFNVFGDSLRDALDPRLRRL